VQRRYQRRSRDCVMRKSQDVRPSPVTGPDKSPVTPKSRMRHPMEPKTARCERGRRPRLLFHSASAAQDRTSLAHARSCGGIAAERAGGEYRSLLTARCSNLNAAGHRPRYSDSGDVRATCRLADCGFRGQLVGRDPAGTEGAVPAARGSGAADVRSRHAHVSGANGARGLLASASSIQQRGL
jgi:hypothetical protein